jgi:hypothetical protein
MYLGKSIDTALIGVKDKVLGFNSPKRIASTLTLAFKQKKIPVSVTIETFDSFIENEYTVGGLYDSNEDKCYVVLYFSTDEVFYLPYCDWDKFMFSVSQTAQHELIHKYQNQFRQDCLDVEPIDFRSLLQDEIEDEMEYLSDIDEIDAYAHDIVMEILKHYPKENPYYILNTINKRRKIDAYSYYKRTFKKEDWSEIRKLLIKKAYKWIPYVTYTRG